MFYWPCTRIPERPFSCSEDVGRCRLSRPGAHASDEASYPLRDHTDYLQHCVSLHIRRPRTIPSVRAECDHLSLPCLSLPIMEAVKSSFCCGSCQIITIHKRTVAIWSPNQRCAVSIPQSMCAGAPLAIRALEWLYEAINTLHKTQRNRTGYSESLGTAHCRAVQQTTAKSTKNAQTCRKGL